jgi:hypothetical protein
MAFMKRANAVVLHPRTSVTAWGKDRSRTASCAPSLTDQATEILGGVFNPEHYLLTHCTIVASVDVDEVPDVKLGNVKVGSKTINRKYADYHIKPQCSQYVNNNGDSWSRDVLLKSYRTFVGAHNFLEHVQIEDQSKGRVIDAAARDIGDSVYIDILVATDRKHASLVRDIESGKLGTLSMGCTTDFTLCSKCGHYAADETELCDHIKYAKLNTFMDDRGQKRVIAELCGHSDYDETGGVQFIEASWVGTPAFGGAVMRNILSPAQAEARSNDIQAVLAAPPAEWSGDAIAKAALAVRGFEFGNMTEEDAEAQGSEDPGAGEADAPAKEEPSAPFSDIADEVYSMVTDRVRKRLKDEIGQASREEAIAPSDWPNDTLNKESTLHDTYRQAINTVVRIASCDASLVDGVASVNQAFGLKAPRAIYRAVLAAGPLSNFTTVDSFQLACKRYAGRRLSPAELRLAVRVGSLLSRRGSITNPPAKPRTRS